MDNNESFSQVIISDILPIKPLPVPIYLKVNGKYIMYQPVGGNLTTEKFEAFVAKNVKYLFVKKDDLKSINEWIKKLKQEDVEQVVAKIGEENRAIADQGQKLEEKVLQVFSSEEINDENVEILTESSSNFVKEVRKYRTSLQIIANLIKFNPNIAGHSVNVAHISTFIAMLLGHKHQMILENVYLGALLHDYAKAKVDPAILENRKGNNYSHAINLHPIEGAKIMRRLKKMPEPVFTIIEQHEEQYDGSGYPKGLKEGEIYELASIVSFANTLENVISENLSKLKKGESESKAYEISFKAIKYNAKKYRPIFIEKVIPALEMAILKKEHPFGFSADHKA